MESNNNPQVIQEIGFSNLDNSLYATVIYQSGIVDFDEALGGNNFSETNALMRIISTVESIYFILLTNDAENVLARLEVKRNSIIDSSKSLEKEIQIPNFNRFKAVLPGVFGIRGAQVESIVKGMKKKNLFKIIGSKQVKGNEFELKYLNAQEEKVIKLSSYDIHSITLVHFLEAYWNTKELIVPSNSNSGGCYIATSCYQYPNAKELMILYQFRDKVLLKNSLGRLFTKIYYKISPSIAKYLDGANLANRLVKAIILNPIVVLIKIIFKKFL